MKKQYFSAKILITLLTICCLQAARANTESTEITIVSDKAELSQKTGVAIHSGNVELVQGSRVIHAEQLTIERNKSGAIAKIIAQGSSEKPATYHFLPEKSALPINGHAEKINYKPTEGILLLMGHAVLDRKKDSFSGPKLEYHMKDEKVLANAQKSGRTTIVLHPQEENL